MTSDFGTSEFGTSDSGTSNTGPSGFPPPDIAAPADPDADGNLAEDRSLLGEPSRQSPVAVVFIAWRFIRNLGMANLAIALFFLISGRISYALLAAAAVAATVGLVFMVAAWWRFVFVVDGDELLVRKGVVNHERLTIPLNRVQSVSIDQKLLNRFIGLVSVSVDTAGSSEAELKIDAVDRGRAEALQRLVAGYRTNSASGELDGQPGVGEGPPGPAPASVTQPTEEAVVIRRTFGELVRIGLTAWPWTGLVVFASLFAVIDDLADLLPIDISEEDVVGGRFDVDVGPGFIAYAIVIGLAMVVAVTVLGAVLQVIRELFSNWGLQLIRTSTGLRRTAGLLNTTSKASTLPRIQGIQTDETPAQRLVGIAKVTLPTIGDGDLSIPGVTDGELSKIRRIVFERSDPPILDRAISRLFVFLAVRNALITVTIGVIFGLIGLRDWRVLIAYLVVPIQWLAARRKWRLRRWGVSDTHLAESYEYVNRHTAELDLIKTQTASVSRSFFERRRGLATVTVKTADGLLAVPLIPLEQAVAVRDRALFVAESGSRAWM